MWKPAALIAALIFVLTTAGAVIGPPPLRASGAPGFDARSAQARLRTILDPEIAHPIDSAAEDRVRENLMRVLSASGFSAEIREDFVCRPDSAAAIIDCGHVRNIVFSTGPEDGPAMLAAAHYDSVAAGPSVSDDGMGLSVLLEVAHELQRRHLNRRIIFLFSDGEEQALLGAYAFAKHDALMKDVKMLINLEARGTRGPAVFFETNAPNGAAVRAYARVARPFANSIMADIYHLLPNSTDVSALRRPALDVINIAVLDGLENYHTPRDTFAAQDMRSLQHMGDAALTILGHWSAGADRSQTADLVYTDILSRIFVTLPAWLSTALLALSALTAFAAFWRAGREARWLSLALPIAGLFVSALLGALFWGVFALLRPGEAYWWAHPEITRLWCVALGLLGPPLATSLLHPRCTSTQAATSSLFCFCALGVLATLAFPGASILFVLPAAIYAAGVLTGFKWKPALTISAILAAIVSLIIWAPMLALNELALGFQFPFANTLLFALATLPWFGALVALKEASWRWPVLTMSGAALLAVIVALVAPSATRERPLPLNIGYVYNAATHQSWIIAGAAQRALPNELKEALPFRREIVFPGDKISYWAAPVAAQVLKAPALEDIHISAAPGGRTLSARLRMNGAARVYIRIPRAALATTLRVASGQANFADTGKPRANGFVTLDCEGRSCDGAAIYMQLGSLPSEWSIIGVRSGLAAPAQAAAAARPQTRTPVHGGDSSFVLSKVRV